MAVTFLTDADRAELERMILEHTGGAVTIESILMSSEDGGENIVTFSDGSTLTVRNGQTGKNGTSVKINDVVEQVGQDGVISNILAFSDGTTLTVTNGKDGEDRVEVPAENFNIPVLSMTGDISAMDKDNAVTLNYVYGERTGTLMCKWQGSSSLSYPKKNYTIKFDEAFEAKEGWGAQKKYCLKANWIDASNIRNLFGATIWGKMVKKREGADTRLAALPKGGAVDGFPVWVKINGEDIGLYTFNIPKDAWMFGMTGTNSNEGILCAENVDMRNPVVCDKTDMEIEYSASEDTTALVASINNLISVINNVQSEADLAAVEAVLDVNSVVDYYILSCLMAHYDGIVKNWLIATYDGTKWFMSAYDMDSTFGNKWDGSGIKWASDWPYFSDLNTSAIFDLVRNWYPERLKARYQQLKDWTLSEIDLLYGLYDIAKSFPAELVARDNRLWPTRPGTMTNNIEQIIWWFRLRFPKLDYNITTI